MVKMLNPIPTATRNSPVKNISATAENDCRTYFHHIRCQNPRQSIHQAAVARPTRP